MTLKLARNVAAFFMILLCSSVLFAQEANSRPDYLLPDLPAALTTYNGRLFSLRVGFAILYDYTFFHQDEESLNQVGKQEDAGDLRAGRFTLGGQIKFRRPWFVIAKTASNFPQFFLTYSDTPCNLPLSFMSTF